MKITQIRETESAEAISVLNLESFVRSEERRVGKECRL